MQESDFVDSSAGSNESYWRDQALALAVEMSAMRGRYEAELARNKSDSAEAIDWLQKCLNEEQARTEPILVRIARRLRNTSDKQTS